MWEKACFFGSCFGRKHFSSIENTGNLSAFICQNIMQGWGGVGHVGVGWGGSCRGGVGWVM